MRRINFYALSFPSKFLAVLVAIIFSLPQLFAQESDNSITKGKKLFNTHCAACHKVNKKAVGPALKGVSTKYDKEWLYSWIKNSSNLIKSGDAQAVAIWEEYNKTPMTIFPQLSNEDIDNIIAYTDYTPLVVETSIQVEPNVQSSKGGLSNEVVLLALALVFFLLALTLVLINKALRKILSVSGAEVEVKKTRTPLIKAYFKNQFLVLLSVIFLMLSSAYFTYGYLMQVGVDQGYMPVQPIHFSHKIHAGENQIDCKYCHSSARVSKHSGIPSLNVCMNCHKNIAEYNGEEDIENGYTKDFYTKEIKKLYAAVGWDEEIQSYTGETEPVKWIRIHNLPDFAYFNHSQHVEIGKVACQKCHGSVEEMEVVYQYSPLTMGWCVNCHRETNVQAESNEYYAKIHEELSKKYGIEKLTVAQMGGLECGKCHY